MAAQRSSLKRKPLSDCTNTIAARTDAVRRKSSLRSAVTQPLKSFSENNNESPVGSLKSNTSTGSNNPPISTSARSALLTASHSSQNEETKKRKDKGKALVEDTVVQFALDGRENEDPKRRKDKGKALVEATVVQFALDGRENEETKRRKDKGKALVDDTVVQFALDGSENAETKRRKDKSKALVEDTVVQFALDGSENEVTKRRKDKGKALIEDTVVQFDPVFPLTLKLSSASVPDQSRCRTVYTRKRFPEARNLRSLKIAEPFSCPPLTRLKDKGKKIHDGGGDGKSGMHRDSLSEPKKLSRGKSKQKGAVDAMPREEVEKLRAYYADIDAFELPVEEAKANDSD